MTNIKAEDLPPEVLDRLGIDLEENGKTRKKPSKVRALGKVLDSIGSLTKDDATWVLTEAMSYVRRQEGQASDTTTVIRAAAKLFKVTPSEIIGRRRTDIIVEARQIVMYLLWLSNRYTLTQIGEALGGRSPATVSHGFQRVSSQLESDISVREHVHRITAELKLLGGDW